MRFKMECCNQRGKPADHENGNFYFISHDREWPIESRKFNKVLYEY